MIEEDKSKQKPQRYRLFVDESGDHNTKDMDTPAKRYLCVLGVWFHQDVHFADFRTELDAFKADIFGIRPDPIRLHRNDIINRRGPFGRLVDPATRARFDDGLLRVIANAKCRVVAVVIDKKSHYERYTNPFHPYHYCLTALLERYAGWLNYKNAVGDVIAESRGREEDLQLKEAYTRLYQSGTRFHDREQFQKALTSKDIKLANKSACVAGLELADMIAYPIKQAFLFEKKIISDPGHVFGKKIIQSLKGKFNRREGTGQIAGYGTVFLK